MPALRLLPFLLACVLAAAPEAQPASGGEQSVARQWNEVLLSAIRDDLARPTVHARNLFHVSVGLYDAWAAYDETASPYLLWRSVGGFACTPEAPPTPADRRAAQEEAMSYAAYRLLVHRFRNSPGALLSLPRFDALMASLGYDPAETGTDVASGDPAALGNALAACVIELGMRDGANEARGYEATHYEPLNPPLELEEPGNPDIVDLDRWQPLLFETFIDQSGNEIPGGVPDFIGPEWGAVIPFAMPAADRTVLDRDGPYTLYGNPGPPPYSSDASGDYQWGFGLVSAWSGHLDAASGVTWDISPGALGNLTAFPETPEAIRTFYREAGEGRNGTGHAANPATGQPYAPNVVPRGDYTRVLAEFWADGPDSETPPGHWYVIANGVSDHPDLVRRWRGDGPELDPLEWDVRLYFALGGAVHDAAVTAWGLKGWYDYIRPISAIRAMAALGQSTEPDAPDYHAQGLPLAPGVAERIGPGDPLAGEDGEHVGTYKVWAWLGHALIEDPETDVAGVGWLRAAEWFPYQRPTFVTPPFAGYVSGHSTFSRAAAEVLTAATGDPFFPGGVGEFEAPQNAFLVFERGPSVDVTLQWATYRDAADQCSLSRIWGGIHPPADDLPGRRLGEAIGLNATAYAERFFSGSAPVATESAPLAPEALRVFPSPVRSGDAVTVASGESGGTLRVVDLSGRVVRSVPLAARQSLSTDGLAPGLYLVRADGARGPRSTALVVLR